MCPKLLSRMCQYEVVKVQVRMLLRSYHRAFHQVAVNQVVVVNASEVEVTVSLVNLFAGNTDIVQSLCSCGMAEHLLEEQKLSRVIAAHNHLVVGKGLTQCVG